MKVFIDVDNTIIDFTDRYFSLYEKKDFRWIRPDKHTLTDYDIRRYVKDEDNFEIMMDPSFYDKDCVKFFPGAVDSVQSILDNFDAYFLTACVSEESFAGKFRLLRSVFGVDYDRYIVCNNKHLVGSADDVLIDDAMHNHLNFNGKSIVFEQPWNNHQFPNKEILLRTDNWVKIVDRLLEGQEQFVR